MGAEEKTWNSRRSEELLGRIAGLMAEPVPRHVPPDLVKRAASPIASFLILMGVLELVMFLLVLMMAMILPKRPPMSPEAQRIVVPIVFLALIGSSVGMIVLGSLSRRRSIAALASGLIYKGKVLGVRLLPARINARSFFRVDVRFCGPDGREIVGKDVVDNFAVDYFIWARDAEKEIDLVYHPNAARRVILPMKMAIGNRFD